MKITKWMRRKSKPANETQDLLGYMTYEERTRYFGLALGEEIATANTAALDELEAVARIRRYERLANI